MRYFLVLFLSVLLLACSSKGSTHFDGEVLKKEIEYKVDLGDPTVEEYEGNWLSKSSRSKFIKDILEKARAGELKVYEFFPDTLMLMSKADIEGVFNRVEIEVIEDENGNEKEVAVKEELDVDGITKMKFREQWIYDEDKAQFHKKVIAVCPMEKIFEEDGSVRGYKGLFWVYLN